MRQLWGQVFTLSVSATRVVVSRAAAGSATGCRLPQSDNQGCRNAKSKDLTPFRSALAAIVVLVQIAAAQVPAGRPLDVMSFNIRYGTANDGQNRWDRRREMLFDLLRDADADLIGLQEALAAQIDEIREAVPVYASIGVGRDDGQRRGEFAAILFRRDRLTVTDASSRDRYYMWQAGIDMILDRPVFGQGPGMILIRYPGYRWAEAPNPQTPHLHDNALQLAAERGLPCLAMWLWLVAAAMADAYREARRGLFGPGWVAGGALAVLAAVMTAGLFEYNFGDSEFLMLFLGLIALPHAARSGFDPGSAAPVPVPAGSGSERA